MDLELYTGLDAYLCTLRADETVGTAHLLAEAKMATRILVIEDNRFIRTMLQRDLTRRGYPQVTAVDNGNHASAILLERQADIIITDGDYLPDGCVPIITNAIRVQRYHPRRIIVYCGNAPHIRDCLKTIFRDTPDIPENVMRRQRNDSEGAYRTLVPVLQKPAPNGVINMELEFILNTEIQNALRQY